MAKGLTKREGEVLEAVVAFEREYGMPPRIRELESRVGPIGPHDGVSTLEDLEQAGLVERESTPRGDIVTAFVAPAYRRAA